MNNELCPDCQKRPPYCRCQPEKPAGETEVSFVDTVYRRAAGLTGKPERQLRATATQVFASMLHHMMERPEQNIWTVAKFEGHKMTVEVDFPPRPGKI